jgi:hypothetical protein
MTESAPSQKSSFLFPSITDFKSAQAATNQGAAVCFAVSFLTGLFLVTTQSLAPAQPISQVVVAAIALYAGFAVMIFKHSRFAAIAALALYVGDKLYQMIQQPGLNFSLVLSILFICMFINGVRGCFAYHRMRKERQS